MAIQKVGDWDKVERLVKAIKPEMVKAKNLSLQRWGLKAEGTAKKHIASQDLGWVPLDPKTIAAKIRKGHSENILVQTSTYFQSITSWADFKANVTYAGVRKEAKAEDGKSSLANIAAVHEFGSQSGRIPARPLWGPTFAETMEWHKKNNTPESIFAKNIKKYGT